VHVRALEDGIETVTLLSGQQVVVVAVVAVAALIVLSCCSHAALSCSCSLRHACEMDTSKWRLEKMEKNGKNGKKVFRKFKWKR